jgi:hypothetical protein
VDRYRHLARSSRHVDLLAVGLCWSREMGKVSGGVLETWLLIPNKLVNNGGWDLLVEEENSRKGCFSYGSWDLLVEGESRMLCDDFDLLM